MLFHNFSSFDNSFFIMFSRVIRWLLVCRQYECSLVSRTEIVCLACKGHSFLVTGRGGTGKSSVVKEVINNFRAAGKRFL